MSQCFEILCIGRLNGNEHNSLEGSVLNGSVVFPRSRVVHIKLIATMCAEPSRLCSYTTRVSGITVLFDTSSSRSKAEYKRFERKLFTKVIYISVNL